MPYFDSNKEFWAAFQRFNALNGEGWRWETPTARTCHTDEFGVKIEAGETYFRKNYSSAYDAVTKISRSSMEKLIFIVVESSPVANQLASLLAKREQEALLEALNKAGCANK